LVLEVL